ncbi:hypothetical protein [Sphingomonas sp.]|uniref:hypothetical protein n=1 Tax=Sphingomonas sp. TaxID=28214 RepID=UPI0035C845FE
MATGARVIAAGFPFGGYRLLATPLPRRLAQAGAATLLNSGCNFVLGLLLVRHLAPRVFGACAMLTTLQGFAGVLLTALVTQQMGHVLPRLRHPARQRASARVFASVAWWCVAAFVPVTAVTLLALDLPAGVVAAGSAFVAATGLRSHARSYLYALRQPRTVLAQDAVFVALTAGGIASVGVTAGLVEVLIVLTLANLVAIMGSPAVRSLRTGRHRVRRHVAAYRRHAARAGWSLVTIALSTASALSPNLALASTGSLAALAVVAAPAALLAPLRLMALTFQASLRAEFAALIHAGRRRAVRGMYVASTALALLACLLLGAALWHGWAWLVPRVFAQGYDAQAIGHATALAFAVVAVNVVRLPGAVLLNVMGVFRFSAATLMVVVPGVLALACWLAHGGHVAAVLYPAVAGELIVLIAELTMLWRRVR